MKKVIVKKQAATRLKSGYPLLRKEDFQNIADCQLTGQWITFVDVNSAYLGTGYIGEQNKGMGWIVAHDETRKIGQSFFEEKFFEAKAVRTSFYHDNMTTAFRLFNGEGDGIGGFTIDRYGKYAVIQWYNESIYTFREEILSAMVNVFNEVEGIYEKNRFNKKGIPETQHVWGIVAPEPLLVKENGVTFATYMNEGMMTGIFLDQKEVRGQLVEGMAIGKRVLNTFSYTGAFSVAAAMGGASETVSVDLAKRSLPKTKEMFEVNGLPLDTNKIVVMDVFDYFKYARRKELQFDTIILDPPSFARNKKRTFSVAQNYGDLVAEVMPLLAPDGLLIASTNAANVTYEKYTKMVEAGIESNHRKYARKQTFRLPADFHVHPQYKEGNYLKVLVYQVK